MGPLQGAAPWGRAMGGHRGEGRGRAQRRGEREREGGGGRAHLGDPQIWQYPSPHHLGHEMGERGGREGEGVAARENQMREREREGGHGGREGRQGCTGLGRARLG
jgi:hypothetical protein